MNSPERARVAYLTSRYPFVSHTFILREVLALRRAGVEVETFTIRRPPVEHIRSEDDREADATTYVIVPPSPWALVGAHLTALARRPLRYLSTLRLALSLRARGMRATAWQAFYFGEAVVMWRECARRGVRHIHAHHANVGSDVALLASHLGEWSWSFTMHGPTELFDVPGHRLAQKVELARFVTCISDYTRSQLMGLVSTDHWTKLHVVHCGVDPALFDVVHRGRDESPPEVLSVGRAVPVKGHAILLEAIAATDAKLTLVGDGPELAALRDLARRLGVSARVTFAGAVGQDEIRSHYARADMFALPSFSEGLPVVLMEAMATGLPVVATHIAGVAELVEDGVSGVLVSPGCSDELADAIRALAAAGAQRRAAMGRAGRAKVAAEFDVDRSAELLRALFAEALGAREPVTQSERVSA